MFSSNKAEILATAIRLENFGLEREVRLAEAMGAQGLNSEPRPHTHRASRRIGQVFWFVEVGRRAIA